MNCSLLSESETKRRQPDVPLPPMLRMCWSLYSSQEPPLAYFQTVFSAMRKNWPGLAAGDFIRHSARRGQLCPCNRLTTYITRRQAGVRVSVRERKGEEEGRWSPTFLVLGCRKLRKKSVVQMFFIPLPFRPATRFTRTDERLHIRCIGLKLDVNNHATRRVAKD